MAGFKPVLVSADGRFIRVPDDGDKLDALYIPLTGRLVVDAEGRLSVDVLDIKQDITTLFNKLSATNQAVDGLISPGDDFNNQKTPGLFEVTTGVYINQPPATSDGTTLKAGVLRVTTTSAGDVFHEYMVTQAGETTGHILGRGFHNAISSWGSWV